MPTTNYRQRFADSLRLVPTVIAGIKNLKPHAAESEVRDEVVSILIESIGVTPNDIHNMHKFELGLRMIVIGVMMTETQIS